MEDLYQEYVKFDEKVCASCYNISHIRGSNKLLPAVALGTRSLGFLGLRRQRKYFWTSCGELVIFLPS